MSTIVITISLLYSGIMAYWNDGYGEDHNYDNYSNSDEDDYSSDEDTDEGGKQSCIHDCFLNAVSREPARHCKL